MPFGVDTFYFRDVECEKSSILDLMKYVMS